MTSSMCMFYLFVSSQAILAMSVGSKLVRTGSKAEDGKVAMEVGASADITEFDNSQPQSAATVLHQRVQGVLNDVEDMARSGVDPQPDKIRTIKDLVQDELVPSLQATRDQEAKQVKQNLAAIAQCNTEGGNSLEGIKSGSEVTVKSDRTSHSQCRETEKEKTSTKSKACKKLDDYLNGIQPPQDIPNPKSRDEMVKYVKAMSGYFCPKGPETTELDDACTKATEEHANHKSGCDTLQNQFESDFCTWRAQLNDQCFFLKKCYETALDAYKTHVDATKTLVSQWKTEYAALKKILCYVDVWLSDDNTATVSSDQLNHCQANDVDTSPMEVDFGTPVAKSDCSLSEVESYPGTPAFKSGEYANFADYVKEPLKCEPLLNR